MMLHALGEASYLREITVIRLSLTKCSLVAYHGTFQNKTCWLPFVHLVQSASSGLAKKALVFLRATCMLYSIMNVKSGTYCPPALKILEVVLDHGNSSLFLYKLDKKASFPHFFRYFKISSKRMRHKEVQVIPWAISDSTFVRCPSAYLDSSKTVFVGALHGMLSAEAVANIFQDLFKGVIYAGIDTDKYKYPIGSGRVVFNNLQSYMKAVSAAFIEIKTPKFTKKVQLKIELPKHTFLIFYL